LNNLWTCGKLGPGPGLELRQPHRAGRAGAAVAAAVALDLEHAREHRPVVAGGPAAAWDRRLTLAAAPSAVARQHRAEAVRWWPPAADPVWLDLVVEAAPNGPAALCADLELALGCRVVADHLAAQIRRRPGASWRSRRSRSEPDDRLTGSEAAA